MIRKTLFIFAISTLVFANGKPTSSDVEIIKLSLNFEFDKADKLIGQLQNESESLKTHYLYITNELIRALYETDQVPFSEKKKVKEAKNKVLIKYCENVIEQYEDKELNLYDNFYLGSIYGLLGRFYGVNRDWYDAFSNGKEGVNILENVVEKDSELTDAYMLLGMMEYYSDRLGGVTEFVVSILGVSGERNTGLKYLQKVESDGTLNNWLATMTLAEIHSRLENNKFLSLPLLKKFHNQFPNNSLFTNWLTYELIELYKIDDAKKIINSNPINVKDIVKAKYFHLNGEYEKSYEIYDEYLNDEKNNLPWLIYDVKINQSLNLIMLNKFEEAKNLIASLDEEIPTYLSDLISNPELTKKLVEKRKQLLTNKDFIHNFDITEFEELETHKSLLNYFLGVSSFNSNNFEEAKKYFNNGIKNSSENIKYLCANYLLNIYQTQDVEISEVENLLDEIDKIDSDSFEYRIDDLETKYNL